MATTITNAVSQAEIIQEFFEHVVSAGLDISSNASSDEHYVSPFTQVARLYNLAPFVFRQVFLHYFFYGSQCRAEQIRASECRSMAKHVLTAYRCDDNQCWTKLNMPCFPSKFAAFTHPQQQIEAKRFFGPEVATESVSHGKNLSATAAEVIDITRKNAYRPLKDAPFNPDTYYPHQRIEQYFARVENAKEDIRDAQIHLGMAMFLLGNHTYERYEHSVGPLLADDENYAGLAPHIPSNMQERQEFESQTRMPSCGCNLLEQPSQEQQFMFKEVEAMLEVCRYSLRKQSNYPKPGSNYHTADRDSIFRNNVHKLTKEMVVFWCRTHWIYHQTALIFGELITKLQTAQDEGWDRDTWIQHVTAVEKKHSMLGFGTVYPFILPGGDVPVPFTPLSVILCTHLEEPQEREEFIEAMKHRKGGILATSSAPVTSPQATKPTPASSSTSTTTTSKKTFDKKTKQDKAVAANTTPQKSTTPGAQSHKKM
jgi:hypothetical protein